MKRVIVLILTLVLLCDTMPATYAAGSKEKATADALYDLGLFSGVGSNADGTPNYDLDRIPTRSEAITMLVRLLGKEAEAKAGTWETPFNDVAEWAKPYVGYAYANGLTSGTSETTFGGDILVNATQYLTFILRALGYKSGVDFQWDKAWELSDHIGMTNYEYNEYSTFLRSNVACVSYAALSAHLKESDESLADKLISEDIFSRADYLKCLKEMSSDPESNETYKSADKQDEFRIETIHYEWDWLIWTWSYDLAIPVEAVEYYRQLERNPYSILWGYSSYVSDSLDDSYLKSLADVFLNTAEDKGYQKDAAVELAISFVQSLEYLPDDEDLGYDYPKYPLETLYDLGGDCEDTSILLVSLIREMGYGCCLIEFDDHMGVGILGSDNVSGRYYEMNGNKYFYVETTGIGWEIGKIPDNYIYKNARIWPF